MAPVVFAEEAPRRALQAVTIDLASNGAVTGLTSALVSRGEDGVTRLLLAPIEIGDGAMIGGHSWLGPGVIVAAGEITPAVYALPAFAITAIGHGAEMADPHPRTR